MLTLEPERLKNQLTTTRKRSPEMKGLFTGDAQAACDFSFSASKFSPFFHRVSVMAAILRASVRRAMVGLMPLYRRPFGLQNGLHHELTRGIHQRDHDGCLMNVQPNILFIVHEGAPFCRS